MKTPHEYEKEKNLNKKKTPAIMPKADNKTDEGEDIFTGGGRKPAE